MKTITTIVGVIIAMTVYGQSLVVPYKMKDGMFCLVKKYSLEKTGTAVYNKIDCIGEGVYQVWNGNQAGLVDKFGKLLLAPVYTPLRDIIEYSDGMYPLSKDGKISFYHANGALAYEWTFNEAPDKFVYYNKGLLNAPVGFVDKKGRIVIKRYPHNAIAAFYDNGLSQVGIKKRPKENQWDVGIVNWGVIDTTGKIIVDLKYESLEIDDENDIIIASNPADRGQHDFVCYNLKGKKIFSGRYYSLDMYCKGALYKAINFGLDEDKPLRRTKGKKLISKNYNDVYNFPGNRIIAYNDTGTHIINHQGKIVMKFPGRADIDRDDFGRYGITSDQTTCVYDSTDKKLFCLTAYSIFGIPKEYKNGYVIIDLTTAKRGFVNLKGEMLVQPVYDDVIYKKDLDIWLVESNRQKFYIDDKGNKYYDSN